MTQLGGEVGPAPGVDRTDGDVGAFGVQGANVAGPLPAGAAGHKNGLIGESGHRILRYVRDDNPGNRW
ncbi:hypothetical protein [Micromonospora sp. NPDC005313]|uniref:hypothetical protein n=1 Tax=Micromonospora sp. NPDC005313 TaxID=3154296 RepID=UPI0033AA6FDD